MLRAEFHSTSRVGQRFSRPPEQNICAPDLELSHSEPRVRLHRPQVRLHSALEVIAPQVGIAEVEVRERLVGIELDRLQVRLACAGHVAKGSARDPEIDPRQRLLGLLRQTLLQVSDRTREITRHSVQLSASLQNAGVVRAQLERLPIRHDRLIDLTSITVPIADEPERHHPPAAQRLVTLSARQGHCQCGPDHRVITLNPVKRRQSQRA